MTELTIAFTKRRRNPGSWISIGAADLQEGFMALTRGVAQPTTF